MIKSITEKYGDDIQINIFYNVKPNIESLINFIKSISYLKMNERDAKYFEAMDYWYEINDDDKWLKKYQANADTNELENILEKHHKWFVENGINFTPCLFIGGHRYPKEYDIADLLFFIDELIDDETLVGKENKSLIAATEKL